MQCPAVRSVVQRNSENIYLLTFIILGMFIQIFTHLAALMSKLHSFRHHVTLQCKVVAYVFCRAYIFPFFILYNTFCKDC